LANGNGLNLRSKIISLLGGLAMKLGILCVGGIASAIVIAVVIPSAASAATFKSVATKDGKTIILLSGEIAEGDTDTLKALIKTANDAGKLVSGVRLNSPGGNLLEGLRGGGRRHSAVRRSP
jgi:membrane-bound ClpP family serine protease